ncbi:hypothetical protein RIR_jg12106.t1 [Rhizophagus irregularis DAOM 181602=DAOM 197198]|nr:hypothetical protein RIR_jg12106.t1 [Rhizophagus irregularis DAOM 181602=DAOM 197198]
MIKQILVDKFNSYKNLDHPENEINEDVSSGEKRKALGIMELMLQKKQKGNLQRNEIDEYLIIPVEPKDIDPCEWWKTHKSQYPILVKIARDHICIPSTSVPSEQAFSKSGELINYYLYGLNLYHRLHRFHQFYQLRLPSAPSTPSVPLASRLNLAWFNLVQLEPSNQ